MKECLRNRKGITIISLIITIILLIILAGLAINIRLGENSLLNKAKYGTEETKKQTATEKINLKITTAQINKFSEEQRMPTLKELSNILGNDNEIAYVTEKSQIASTKYEVGENPKSIYTKLKDYNYEFEINSSLELASINGVKIAKGNNEVSIYPDYANQEKITFTNKSWEADRDGYVQIFFQYTGNKPNSGNSVKINEKEVFWSSVEANWCNIYTPLLMVKKGDIIQYSNSAQNVYTYYYPFR